MAQRILYTAIVLLVLAVALLLRIIDPAPVARLRSQVFDTYQQLNPRLYQPHLPVRIVDIDEASLKKIGQWPWSRAVLADLVGKIENLGAAAIAMDLIFAEKDRLSPEQVIHQWASSQNFATLKEEAARLIPNDKQFADAIARAPATLGFVATHGDKADLPVAKAGISFAGDDPKLFVPHYASAATSLRLLQDQAKGSGALNWIPEHDQIIRRLPLLVRVGDSLYPSLAAEALRIAQGASGYIIKSSGASGEESFGAKTGISKIRIGQITVPTDRSGQIWLRFTRSDKRRYFPASRILDGTIKREDIEGRIILIGTSAAGLFDLRATPLDASIPGVEIHAQAIEQMLTQAFLHRPDYMAGAELIYILVLGALLAVMIYTLGAVWSAVLGLFAIGTVFTVSWLAYNKLSLLADPVYPAIALTAVYLAGTLYVYLRTEKERNQVRSAFSLYMAPALVEELAKDPSKLRLGGEMRELTLLFCDVRGFTTISEGMDAKELTRFINALFTPLTKILLDNRGTIDKYMGDAIMAFWNAPLEDRDHPKNACHAALGLVKAMAELNRRWRARVEQKGETYNPVRLGIGLNTGECCVGNLGSEQRFDYSAIGDNVNIASRLEGLTKTYGVTIIAGEPTQHMVPELGWIELDRVRVKGKMEATNIFMLLGDEIFAQTQEYLALKAVHDAMLDAYRAQDWNKAEERAKECLVLGGSELKYLYGHYASKIAAYRANPPEKNWDGSAVAETK